MFLALINHYVSCPCIWLSDVHAHSRGAHRYECVVEYVRGCVCVGVDMGVGVLAKAGAGVCLISGMVMCDSMCA